VASFTSFAVFVKYAKLWEIYLNESQKKS